MLILAQALINGILTGGLYALIAVGLTLTFGVMRLINLFHGELVMVGMYITFWLFVLLGMEPLASVPVAAMVLFLVGILMQRFLIQPILKAPEMNQVLLTLGISMFLFSLAQLLFTGKVQTVRSLTSGANLRWGEVSVSFHYALSFAAALVITALLYLLLMRSDLGKAVRAAVQDRQAAQMVGVNVERVFMLTFGIGAAAAGAAGAMLLPIYYVFPQIGWTFLFKAFVVVVLGGLGSLTGALAGGLILGIVEALNASYVSAGYQNAVGFAIFVLILLLRPSGLLGGSRV